MDLPTLIRWMTPFPLLGVLGGIYIFHLNFDSLLYAISGDSDQTPNLAASDLGLRYLHMSHKKDAMV